MLTVADDAAARPKCELPMSFVSMARTIAALIAYPFRTAGSCGRSNTVVPPHWEATWSSATCVALNTPPMTPALWEVNFYGELNAASALFR